MSDSGFRRRSQQGGAAVLLDEAVGIVASDPLRWGPAALLPSLPLLIASLVFLHAHRVAWLDRAWDGRVGLLSAALSAAVVVGLGLRAVGQGWLARALVATVHPAALPLDAEGLRRAPGRLPFASLFLVGVIGPTLVGLGLLCAGFPALLVAGWLLPATSVAAIEGLDAAATLRRLTTLPRGTTPRGASALILHGLVLTVGWINVFAGALVAVYLLRMLTGVEVTALLRALGPTNPVAVIGSLLVASWLADGVWSVQRVLVYLDARLKQSGSDLTERWEQLRARQARRLGVALLALALLPAVARAEPDEEVQALLQLLEDGAGIEAPDSLQQYEADLEHWRQRLDVQIEAYEASGFEDLELLRDEVATGAVRTLTLPDGSELDIDSTLLLDDMPTWIHDDASRGEAVRFGERLAEAEARLRAFRDPAAAVEPGLDPAALLEQELAEGYQLDDRAVEGDDFREGLGARFRAWLEDFWHALEPDQQPTNIPRRGVGGIDLKWIGVLLAIVAAVGLIALFARSTGRHDPSAPELDALGAGAGAALPDARQRSPSGWRSHADALAAEGLLRDAIRAQFLAVLARLDRTREIEYRPERTNGEHLGTFRGEGVRRSSFRDATLRFERAWYGEVVLDDDAYRAMTLACGQLVPARIEAEDG